MSITIVDYGMGNLRSVFKSILRIGVEAHIATKPEEIARAVKIVLPGVGHFKKGMENLQNRGMVEVLAKKVMHDHTPVLGICLGMQLLTHFSEEGNVQGLGFVDARTLSFRDAGIDKKLKIPHMGWNMAKPVHHQLFQDIEREALFYFVHSFFVKCNNPENVLCTTTYGIEFHSGFNSGNIFGVQFHPEKSHGAGLQMLKNFAAL